MSDSLRYAVLGAGSWGTALAKLISENGHSCTLWGRNAEVMQAMAQSRQNNTYFDEPVTLPEGLHITGDLQEALSNSNIVLLVTPCAAFSNILDQCADFLKENPRLVWACKGLDKTTGRLLSDVATEKLGSSVQQAFISGPNFAKEVMGGLPTATTVASTDKAFAQDVAESLHNDWFRAYSIDDMVSAQIGGALKNVYAIAAGICDGMGYGANARAALLTRAMAELVRLGQFMGGKSETFMGLTGMGDLVLTCTDDKSRNRRFGLLLASGKDKDAAVAEIGQAVEGLYTTQIARTLAKNKAAEMPILEQVYQVIYEGLKPADAVKNLLSRNQKNE